MHRFALLLLFAIVLTACGSDGSTADTDDISDPTAKISVVDTLPAGTFGAMAEGSFSGDLYVRGYADTVTVDEPFCTEYCQKFSYVFFHITETGNNALGDFLPMNEGNAYAGSDSVGLGCEEDGIIRFTNHSDQLQMREMTLSAEVSQKILDSSKREPVVLHLTKLPLAGGTEAPACYSHFSNIEVSE